MESREMLFGFITNGRFIFSTLRSSDDRVSSSGKIKQKIIEHSLKMQECHLDLSKILIDAGFVETKIGNVADNEEKPFTFDSKSNIIEFFSENKI
jgi:hypothetical protein